MGPSVRTHPASQFRSGILLFRLTALYILFGVMKHVLHVTALARWAWHSADPRYRADPHRWARAALRVSTWFKFGDRNCLQRSLLLYRVLSQAGADPVLVIAFSRTGQRVQGHALVSVDGKLVHESADGLPPFEPVLRFGPGGRLLAACDHSRTQNPAVFGT
jgi:hypothetical protein